MAFLVPALPYIAAAGTVLQGIGAIQQTRQQAAVARSNALAAEREARLAEEQGAIEARRARLRAAELLGAQRAALARAGVDLGAGSALFLTEAARREQEHDIDLLRRAADLEAAGFRFEAARFRSQARALKSTIPLTVLGTGLGAALAAGSILRE